MRAQAVEQQDVGPLAHRQHRDAAAGQARRRGRAAAAGGRRAAGTGPRSRRRGRGRRGRRAGAARTPRRRDSSPWRRRSQVSASVPMTTSGRRRVTPLRTRAPCSVQRTSHVWPDVAEAHVVGRVEARARRRDSAPAACGTPRRRASQPGGMTAATRPRRGTVPYRSARRPSQTSRSLRRLPAHTCAAIRLHDTRTGAARRRSSRATRARSGSTRAGPTVYSRIHVGNARPFVVFSLLKRFLEHEGYDATLVTNVTDVNDKIYDAARERGRAAARAGARDDRRLHGRHRRRSGSGGPTTSRWPRETIDGDRRPDRRR